MAPMGSFQRASKDSCNSDYPDQNNEQLNILLGDISCSAMQKKGGIVMTHEMLSIYNSECGVKNLVQSEVSIADD